MKRNYVPTIILNLIMVLMSLMCILPIILVLSISLTSEAGIAANGYTFFPSEFSLDAYQYIFAAGDTIFSAYAVTIVTTVVGTVLSTLVIALFAYPLSRRDFKLRKVFTFYIFFTMLFSGGTVSWYIICTKTLHLSNTLFAMIVPYLMNAWYVIIMRTFFASAVPESIIESAKLDGAGEFRIFFRLVLPISLPGLATVALFSCLGYWNDWWLPLMFITEPKLYNLQFLLQSMLANIQMLTENQSNIGNAGELMLNIPKEGARMALCVIAMGPIILVYPFFQKYFIQGLTVGSIKG